jgi:hypothetical protein
MKTDDADGPDDTAGAMTRIHWLTGHSTTTTGKELDARMEADSYLTSKGVLSPRQRTPEGDAAEAELTKALEEARRSDLPMILVPGQGWKLDTEGLSEARMAGTLAAKRR